MRGMIRRSSRILTLALLGPALFAGSAHALTTLDAAYGTPWDAESAKVAAMGSVGTALFQGSGNLISNPAMLAQMESRFLVELNGGIFQANEDRFQPLYNSFDSYVTDTVIASNRNSYGQFQGGVLFRLSKDRKMTLGVGIFDRYLFDYDYFEEVRDPSPFVDTRDAVIQVRDYKVQGRLHSITAGYGMELIPQLSLGLGVNYYYGTLDHRVSTSTMPIYEDTFLSDPGSSAFDHDLSGWSVSLGLEGTVSERVDLGVSFESAFTAEGAITSQDSTIGSWVPYDRSQKVLEVGSSDVQVKYPGTLRAGVTLHPRNLLATTFAVDVVRRFWEDVSSDSYRTEAFTERNALRDTWDVRVGLEHIFYNKVPARFGFRYLENYADPESERSIFSAGLGWSAGEYTLDLALQYHRQTTRQNYLFDRTLEWTDRPADVPEKGLSKVEDGMVTLLLGISRRF